MTTIWGHKWVVRIRYPKRQGKGDLVKGLPSQASAVLYAKKVAGRGRTSSIMGNWRDNPIACVYDLRNWNAPVECYSMRPVMDTSKKGGMPYYRHGAPLGVRKVPPTFSGFKRKARRR